MKGERQALQNLNRWGLPFFLLALVIFGLGVGHTWREPVTADEPYFLYAAQSFNARGTFDCLMGMTATSASSAQPQTTLRADIHPPVLIFLIAKAGKWLGDYVLGARLVVLACVICSAALLLGLAWKVFLGHAQRVFFTFVTGALYLANPVTVKSAVAIDSDQSTFTLAFLIFQAALFAFLKRRTVLRWLLLEAAMTLCFFGKVTASFVLFAVLVLFVILYRKKISGWQVAGLLLLFPLAAIIFYGVMRGLHLAGGSSFVYVFSQFHHMTSTVGLLGQLRRIGLSAVTTFLWIGVAFVGLFLAVFWRKVKEYWQGSGDIFTDFVCLGSLAFVFGHLIVGGTYNHFPRYMTPGIPGFCLLSAWFVSRRLSGSLAIAWFIVPLAFMMSAFWYWIVVGDYLYGAIFMPRAAVLGVLERGVRPVIGALLVQLVCYALPFLVLFLWSGFKKKNNVSLSFLALLGASFLGMDMNQAWAGYGTYYLYGEAGRRQVVNLARSLGPDRAIMATYPLVFYKGDGISLYHLEREWYTEGYFLKVAKDPRTAAIVYGVMDFPVALVRGLLGTREMEEVLKSEGFKKEHLGSYTVWRR